MGDPDPPGPPAGGLCREIETTLLLLLLLSHMREGQWTMHQEGLNRRRVYRGWETWQEGDFWSSHLSRRSERGLSSGATSKSDDILNTCQKHS